MEDTWYYFNLCFVLALYGSDSSCEQCITPTGKRSECVSIYNCIYAYNAVKVTPRSAINVEYLRKMHCGFIKRVPKVCCGPVPEIRGYEDDKAASQEDKTINEDAQLASQCGRQFTLRIYGGTESAINDFPWLALLGYESKIGEKKYACGGALVNRRYVLTAAHCVNGLVQKRFGELVSARLGEYDISTFRDCVDDFCIPPYQEKRIDRALVHPSYNMNDRSKVSDIALLRLAKRVTYNDYVKPICLSRDISDLEVGDHLYVSGWGATEYDTASDIKLKLMIPYFDHAKCQSLFREKGAFISEKHICAGGEFAKDTCKGDSGGPLMRGLRSGVFEAIGVISFGNGCGADGWPGVYTSIPAHYFWIVDTLAVNA